MENKLTCKEILQLLKNCEVKSNDYYQFAFPEWIIEEYEEQFDFKDNEVYFQGGKVLVYPNKLEY